jgi:hypothetical protein
MKKITAMVVLCLVCASGFTGFATINAEGALNAISAPLTFQFYRIAQQSTDMDFGTGPDFYWTMKLLQNNYGSSTYNFVEQRNCTQPINVNDIDIQGADFNGKDKPWNSATDTLVINPNSNGDYLVMFYIQIDEDDTGGGSADDTCDCSVEAGDGFGDGGENAFGIGCYLRVYYNVLDGSMYYWGGATWLSASSYWNVGLGYYVFSGQDDGSTGDGKWDVLIGFKITDTYGDSTAPTTTCTPSPSTPNGENGWYNTNVDVTLSATDNAGGTGVDGINYQINSGGYGLYSSAFIVSTPGSNSVQYYSWDSTNIESVKTTTIKIDKIAPTTPTPNDGVAGWTNDNTPTFTWTASTDTGGSGIAGYFWNVNNGTNTWTTLTAVTLPAQVNGIHCFNIRAKDIAGNNGTYGFHVFQTDITAPATPVPDDGTTGWSNVKTPTFTWAASTDTGGSEVSGYFWNVDNGTDVWTSINSIILPAQLDGVHSIFVKARDNAGNEGNYGTHIFYIDSSVPVIPTISSTSHTSEITWYSNNDPSFSWISVGGPSPVTYYYQLDNSNPTTYSTALLTHDEVNVADGEHKFFVKAVDTGGSSTIDNYTIRIDTVAPSSSVGALTTYWSRQNTFNAIASDLTSDISRVELFYKFSHDNSTWFSWNSSGNDTSAPWSWIFNYPDGDGYYQFYSIAVDQASNIEAVSTFDTKCGWDSNNPISAVNVLSDTQISASFSVSWSGVDHLSGIKSFDVQFKDGSTGTWADWKTQITTTDNTFEGIAGHTYYFRSRAYDNAGNTEDYPTLADTSTKVEILVNPGWIGGHVYKYGTQIPIDTTTVSILGGTSGATNSNGLFNISVSAGTYSISAEKVGYQRETNNSVIVTAGVTTSLDFYLAIVENAGWVSGYITLTGSSIPLQGVIVSRLTYSAITDSVGHYNLTLPAGTHTLTASKNGYSTTTASVTITTGNTVIQDFNMAVITNPGWATGYVYINGTTTSIADASVTVTNGPTVLTDVNGHYNITLENGAYTLTVMKNGYNTSSIVIGIVTGSETHTNFNLDSTQRPEPSTQENILSEYWWIIIIIIVVLLVILFLVRKKKEKEPEPVAEPPQNIPNP